MENKDALNSLASLAMGVYYHNIKFKALENTLQMLNKDIYTEYKIEFERLLGENKADLEVLQKNLDSFKK